MQSISIHGLVKCVATVVAIGFCSLLASGQVHAATSGSWWSAGHIIDDQVFYNKNAMTVNQIQQFLNSKVSACDNNGTEQYAGTGQTVYQYFHARGYKFPVTCLKDYYENPDTHENNLTQTDGQAAPVPSGGLSAAQLIWNVSQQYNINPEVLLVTLQKEEVLVLDDSPLSIQYRTATGYGCPDTAPCDSQYYGFYNQIENTAWQFRHYADNPNAFNFLPGTNNFIQWNPSSSCGGSTVYIVNQATASLYNYTPYQPNQSALNNLYGSGDSCSAYGNRNFWRYFYDWFGSPLVSFKWQSLGYQFFDQTESFAVDNAKLLPGRTYMAKLSALNTGTAVWTNDGATPIALISTNPAADSLHTNSWISSNWVVYLQESTVAPGQMGHFKFLFQAPLGVGRYYAGFRPVAQSLASFNDTGDSLGFSVDPGTYQWKNLGYQFFDQTESFPVDSGNLEPGQKYIAKLAAINTGTATWTQAGPGPMTLAAANPSRNSILCTAEWISCNRPVYLQESTVAPGQMGHFKFLFQTPYTGGRYYEYFKPVAEFVSWTNDSGDSLGFGVKGGTYSWSSGGYLIFDETESHTVDPGQLHAGTKYIVKLHAINTGTATWKQDGGVPVTLHTSSAQDHNSFLCYSSWLSCNKPVALQQASVAPGAIGSFKFMIQAPSTPGPYREYFTPVAEHIGWFNDTGDSLGIIVH